MPPPLSRRLVAEFLGSALLAAVVIGSGIAAQRLSQDTGLRLLRRLGVGDRYPRGRSREVRRRRDRRRREPRNDENDR